jgi:hypothetical protein
MARVIIWDAAQAKKELFKRLDYAKRQRRYLEQNWQMAENTAYRTSNFVTNIGSNPLDGTRNQFDSVDNSSADIGVAYAFKNLRFIHAQLSSNPPSVLMRPATSDVEDKYKAETADKLCRYALRKYKIQEYTDLTGLNTLLYGTGFLKLIWDSELGEPLEEDENGDIVTEGDISFSVVSNWDVWLDPDANHWEDVRYCWIKFSIPLEEAKFKYPDKLDMLQKFRKSSGDTPSDGSALDNTAPQEEVVEFFEYWEKGLPLNGYLGRYAVCLPDGTPIEEVKPNPHRFKTKGNFELAELPLIPFTDVDVPGKVWGKSAIDYVAPVQDTLNRLDTVMLDNIQAHGVARLILPEGAEIADGSITNTPWDIIKVTGNSGAFHMSPPQTMPAMSELRAQMRVGIDDIWGVNDAMMGQVQRETSGNSMQFATNQGNMIRHRLFNKYTMFVEQLYRTFIKLVIRHWTTKRTIQVIGKERALSSIDIKGADVDGGYDIVAEYGQSFSLDPLTRKQEIMQMAPFIEKAGLPPRYILKMFKLADMEGIMDIQQLAEDRQREIIERMIAFNILIEPQPFEDHENMLAAALTYRMTKEFQNLPKEKQDLILQHIQLRVNAAAAEKTGQQPGQIPPPGQEPGPTPTGQVPGPTPPGEPNPVEEAQKDQTLQEGTGPQTI